MAQETLYAKSDWLVDVKKSLREDALRSAIAQPTAHGDSPPPEPSTPTDASDTAHILDELHTIVNSLDLLYFCAFNGCMFFELLPES